jgi:hypothetical protein
VTDHLGDEMTTTETTTNATTGTAAPAPPTEKEKAAAVRQLIFKQLLLELALPIGGYYLLRGFGMDQWLALVCSAGLALPAVIWSLISQRRVNVTVFFSLSIVILGTVIGLISGDARLLAVRDGWITAILGLWILGSLLTKRPFIMAQARAILISKVGERGADEWEARWPVEPEFRTAIRTLTAVWGVVFTLDSLVRVLVAYTLPIDAIPLVSTVQWLVVLGALILFHVRYINTHGLKV